MCGTELCSFTYKRQHMCLVADKQYRLHLCRSQAGPLPAQLPAQTLLAIKHGGAVEVGCLAPSHDQMVRFVFSTLWRCNISSRMLLRVCFPLIVAEGIQEDWITQQLQQPGMLDRLQDDAVNTQPFPDGASLL